MSSDFIFTVVYVLLCICLIYPPTEFVSAGVTIENLFSFTLGNQHEGFVLYHLKRHCLILILYSLLPIDYIILTSFLGYTDFLYGFYQTFPFFSSCFLTFAVILPATSIYQVLNWKRNNYEKHPGVINISKFCNNNVDWKTVANNIDMEYRSVDKICLQTSTIVTVVVTENWIIKVTPLTINVVHQSDASLVVKEANSFDLSPNNTISVQYLNIEVKSERQGVEPFIIRINASDFRDLKDRVARSITILPNVKFHQSILDQFVDVFKETISNNPIYETNEISDRCIGCMTVDPNVKLQKLCDDSSESPDKCTNCYCRPMWCSDCMAKWFASRQEAERVNTWLSSKCTCPMCRATFCMLDVCLIDTVQRE